MSDHREKVYQLAVEWNNPFAGEKNRGLVLYTLTLPSEVKAEDFEAFVKEELSPAVEGILTRAIQYGPVYLLEDAGDGFQDPLSDLQRVDVAQKLASLSTRTLDQRFLVRLGPGSFSDE